jgi:hypothetical protein
MAEGSFVLRRCFTVCRRLGGPAGCGGCVLEHRCCVTGLLGVVGEP